MMNTWKQNLEETKQRYINWWNHKGIILNMWEHFQEGVKPHADIPMPPAPRDLNQKWFDPQWRADYLDWYVAHSSLMADMLPVANTQLGPGSLAAILGGVFEEERILSGFTLTLITQMISSLTPTTRITCFTRNYSRHVNKRHKDITMWVCQT